MAAEPTAGNTGTSHPSGRAEPWLHGPVLDLGLGCGGVYLWVLLLYWVNAPALYAALPAALPALLILLISMPHYGGTLLRVYEERSERRKYFWFSVVFTGLIVVVFYAGLVHVAFGSWVFTLYLTWSPWHYSGQNYGIAVMFLRRRGIEFDDTTKRLLYATFVLSFALVFLIVHTEKPSPVSPGDAIAFVALGIPIAIAKPAVYATGLVYLVAMVLVGWRLLRASTVQGLLPVALICLSQGLWFAIPYGLRPLGLTTGAAPLDDYFDVEAFTLWMVLAHAIQYLWVTSYYAKASPRWRSPAHYYLKAAAAASVVWTLPAIVMAPDFLGPRSFQGGLSMMIVAAVNLHHFVLDGAIWKLRNLKIAKVLIGTGPRMGVLPSPYDGTRKPWRTRLVWSTMSLLLVITYFTYGQVYAVDVAVNDGRLSTAIAGLERLSWFGRDHEETRRMLAVRYYERGEVEQAERQLRRELELAPDVEAWRLLLRILREGGRTEAVIAASQEALESFPGEATYLVEEGLAWLESNRADEARRALERAAHLEPDSPRVKDALERLESAR